MWVLSWFNTSSGGGSDRLTPWQPPGLQQNAATSKYDSNNCKAARLLTIHPDRTTPSSASEQQPPVFLPPASPVGFPGAPATALFSSLSVNLKARITSLAKARDIAHQEYWEAACDDARLHVCTEESPPRFGRGRHGAQLDMCCTLVPGSVYLVIEK